MTLHNYFAAPPPASPSPSQSGGGGTGTGGGLDLTSLSTFLTTNVVPIAATVLGILVFFLARKKKIDVVFEKFAIAMVAFMIIAMGANGLGIDIAGKTLHTIFG